MNLTHLFKQTSIFVATLGVLATANAAPYGENTLEQKSVLATEATIGELIEKLNQNCGTKASYTINWKAYEPISKLSAKERDGREMENIYAVAGSMLDGHIRDLGAACDDALFKSNIAKKLKSIVATPRSGDVNAKDPSHTFKLNNGVLNITYHFYRSNTTTDTLRKLF
jgi:hypothetical protein